MTNNYFLANRLAIKTKNVKGKLQKHKIINY